MIFFHIILHPAVPIYDYFYIFITSISVVLPKALLPQGNYPHS